MRWLRRSTVATLKDQQPLATAGERVGGLVPAPSSAVRDKTAAWRSEIEEAIREIEALRDRLRAAIK